MPLFYLKLTIWFLIFVTISPFQKDNGFFAIKMSAIAPNIQVVIGKRPFCLILFYFGTKH